ncbi:Solute carrier family 17 member 9 [Toxocara canis]|uniref:Solute carrier family 17 member 9 n=1 Tax=Toxocara canis TaxID=6265 RepID=A0A0B2UXQ7_TOXCA|nr:Solute carrier family 17 member 9 [Toxocara canis]
MVDGSDDKFVITLSKNRFKVPPERVSLTAGIHRPAVRDMSLTSSKKRSSPDDDHLLTTKLWNNTKSSLIMLSHSEYDSLFRSSGGCIVDVIQLVEEKVREEGVVSECRVWTANLFLGTCTLYASRVALPICATAVAHEYAWNKNDSGTVLSCFFWGYACTQLVAGAIADRFGGEGILRLTTLLWALLTFFTPQLFDLSYSTHTPFFFVILVRILTGIGQGFHLPSMASLISRHLTASDKGRVFGVCLAGSHFGTVIAGAVGSLLLDAFGWRILFQFVGLISLMWWIVFRMMTSPRSRRARTASLAENASVHPADDAEILLPHTLHRSLSTPNLGAPETSTVVPWSKLFRHPAFWAAAVAQYCGANAYYTMFSWLPSYFSDNFPNAKAVVYNVVPSAAIVVTSFCAPFMATRLFTRLHSLTAARRIMEGVSLAVMALCLLVVSWSSHFTSTLLIFTLAMAARGLHHGGVSVNPCDFAPQHTGAVFGIFNSFASVTGFIGVYVAGYILHETGNNWTYVFVFTSAQCVLGALAYSLMGTAKRII